MLSLKTLLTSVDNSTVAELKKKVYISPIIDEDDESISRGKFSLIYSEDLLESFGVSFIDGKRLYVYHLTKGVVLLDCNWNEDRKSWEIIESAGDVFMSDIIVFARKMKQLLS